MFDFYKEIVNVSRETFFIFVFQTGFSCVIFLHPPFSKGDFPWCNSRELENVALNPKIFNLSMSLRFNFSKIHSMVAEPSGKKESS